jgi:hypothetical protein
VRPLRIVAKGESPWYLQTSRRDLRRAYLELREYGMSAKHARNLITDIVLSGSVRRTQR